VQDLAGTWWGRVSTAAGTAFCTGRINTGIGVGAGSGQGRELLRVLVVVVQSVKESHAQSILGIVQVVDGGIGPVDREPEIVGKAVGIEHADACGDVRNQVRHLDVFLDLAGIDHEGHARDLDGSHTEQAIACLHHDSLLLSI
jgi:hypothetical protein